MARILIIAYTTYFHDGRVKRHAESLAERGDHVDVICLKGSLPGGETNVNVIGLEMPRYRGSSRSAYFRSYLRFFGLASLEAIRRSRRRPVRRGGRVHNARCGGALCARPQVNGQQNRSGHT